MTAMHRRMLGAMLALAATGAAFGCPGHPPVSPHAGAGGGSARGDARDPGADARPPAGNVPDAGAATDARAEAADVEPSLEVEAREADPRSEMVTIKLVVEPAKRAEVFWGAKDLGLAPLEIQRPRGSGPVDLVLRAPGYLTFHTRAYTDRDDKIPIRMVPEVEAPRMFGYRALASPPPSTAPSPVRRPASPPSR